MLVLGAGVSVFYGLPRWRDLLSELKHNDVGHSIPENPDDYPGWAQQILDELFDGDETALQVAVSNGLYGPPGTEIDINAIHEDRTLRALCALSSGSHRGKVSSIVTFNYDSLLESYFGYEGLSARPFIDVNQPQQSADVTVYHPHGYLPHRDLGQKSSTEIVLATTQYDRAVRTQWENILENLFAQNFCIFVGLSGDDERIMGILERAAERNEHAAAENYWGIRICSDRDRKIDEWDQRKVFSRVARHEEFASTISDTLYAIAQRAADLR